MTGGQTIRLASPAQRDLAKRLIDCAPDMAVVNIRPEKRSLEQSARMWAALSDISRAKPDGRAHTPEIWKALMMQACGHEVQFLMGIDGNPFPHGFKSSNLTKAQMSELLSCIYAYGDSKGVHWSERNPYADS